MTALIAGLGNVLLGDEGLGVHVVRALDRRRDELPGGVEVLEAGTALLDLLPEVSRYQHVIFVDAIRLGGEPGTIYHSDLEANSLGEIEGALPISLHDSDLFTILGAGKLLGLLPQRLSVIGAEPASLEPGLDLSGPLARAADRIVAVLLGQAKGVDLACMSSESPAR
jgi:hydrogenase maturation protease